MNDTNFQIPNMTPRGMTESVADSLPRVVERIAKKLRPEKIILFGSYAVGTPTPDSDVDLLVIMRTRKKGIQRILPVSRLIRPRPFPVDIFVKTPIELSYELAHGNFFLKEMVQTGKVLYARNEQ